MMKAVIKFLDGTEIRATIQFFNLNKISFPFVIENEEGKEETRSIQFDEIKAVFFLKDVRASEEEAGPHVHRETIDQTIYAGSISTKLLVEFKDGEILHGSTLKYNPSEKGFFLIPLNPADESDRIYINARAVKRVDRSKLLGRILVDQQKITSDQLEHALAYQREKRDKKIGAILLENGLIGEKQLHESLKRQKGNNKMLGEILVDAGYITPEQLAVALRIQQGNRKKKLGEILVDLNYVTPNDICIALSSQLDFPWLDLSKEIIPPEIAAIFSEETVRKFEVLAVGIKDERTLIVASANPSISDLAKELSQITSKAIEFVIVYDGYLNTAINKFFPLKDQTASEPTPDPGTGTLGKGPPAARETEK